MLSRLWSISDLNDLILLISAMNISYRNTIQFTPTQIEAIRAGMQPGLTMVSALYFIPQERQKVHFRHVTNLFGALQVMTGRWILLVTEQAVWWAGSSNCDIAAQRLLRRLPTPYAQDGSTHIHLYSVRWRHVVTPYLCLRSPRLFYGPWHDCQPQLGWCAETNNSKPAALDLCCF